MAQIVDGNRLKELLKRQKLSQKALSGRTGLSTRTISRLVSGQQTHVRAKATEALCKALDADADVLSGKESIPAAAGSDSPDRPTSSSQMNVRIDEYARNALALAARKYCVPPALIIELSPLLFALAAEGCLAERRAKLAELKGTLKHQHELMTENFRHLPAGLYPFDHEEDLVADEKSILARDIFANFLPGANFDLWGPMADPTNDDINFDSDEHNPFIIYLKKQALLTGGVAKAEAVGENGARYEVCRDVALELTGNDEGLANYILDGSILVRDIPRELLKEDKTAERMQFLHARANAIRKQSMEPINIDFDAIDFDSFIKQSTKEREEDL